MTERTYRRLKNKWPSFDLAHHFEVEQFLSEFKAAGGKISRGLKRPGKVPGLFICERMEHLLNNSAAWKKVLGKRRLKKQLKNMFDSWRRR